MVTCKPVKIPDDDNLYSNSAVTAVNQYTNGDWLHDYEQTVAHGDCKM